MAEYTFEKYAQAARSTAVYAGRESVDGLIYATMGLAGEAGEVANQVKKVKRDDQGVITTERRVKILDELGDCLWYVQAIADEIGVIGGLETVAMLNAGKLAARAEQGTLHGDRRDG